MIKQKLRFIILLTFVSVMGWSQTDINQLDTDGNRHGTWRKNFDGTDQIRYEGQFEHGKEVGQFKFYQIVGKKSKLAATKDFNHDNDLTQVTFYTLKGMVMSKGKMRGKTYVGEWLYYHKNSKVLMTKEIYNDEGQLNGLKKVFYENGQLAEETPYRNGKIHGEVNYYSEDGVLVKTYNYENDQLHGPSKHFNRAGAVTVEGSYKRNKKTGIWKYYANGELVDQKDFTYIPKYKKKQ